MNKPCLLFVTIEDAITWILQILANLEHFLLITIFVGYWLSEWDHSEIWRPKFDCLEAYAGQ